MQTVSKILRRCVLAVLMLLLLLMVHGGRFVLRVIVMAFEMASEAADEFVDVVLDKDAIR